MKRLAVIIVGPGAHRMPRAGDPWPPTTEPDHGLAPQGPRRERRSGHGQKLPVQGRRFSGDRRGHASRFTNPRPDATPRLRSGGGGQAEYVLDEGQQAEDGDVGVLGSDDLEADG